MQKESSVTLIYCRLPIRLPPIRSKNNNFREIKSTMYTLTYPPTMNYYLYPTYPLIQVGNPPLSYFILGWSEWVVSLEKIHGILLYRLICTGVQRLFGNKLNGSNEVSSVLMQEKVNTQKHVHVFLSTCLLTLDEAKWEY